jgi:hypothetical protein
MTTNNSSKQDDTTEPCWYATAGRSPEWNGKTGPNGTVDPNGSIISQK